MAYDFGSFEKDALTKPRDKAWDNWAKFEKVGDKVQGYIRDVFFRKAEGEFQDQRGITLEQPDGTLVNVGIKRVSFVLAKTDNLRLGDPMTMILEKEIPPRVKGYSPTKQFGFYGKNLEENLTNKTVKELENEDIINASAKVDDFEDTVPEGAAGTVAAGTDKPAEPAPDDFGAPSQA